MPDDEIAAQLKSMNEKLDFALTRVYGGMDKNGEPIVGHEIRLRRLESKFKHATKALYAAGSAAGIASIHAAAHLLGIELPNKHV